MTHKEPIVSNIKMPKIYIAGPMSGHPNGNFEAFFAKEKQLLSEGWDVVNPARYIVSIYFLLNVIKTSTCVSDIKFYRNKF